MKRFLPTLQNVERIIAFGLTFVLVVFHFVLMRNAGGLWRDEVNTVAIANLPRIGDVWAHLEFDSFPMVWLLIVRFWTQVGLNSDVQYRILGFITGLALIGAVWFSARRLKSPAPLIALLLLGFNGAIIRWGDSIRAYGLGMALILITLGLIWDVTQSPTRWRVLLAGLFAVLSVHTLYYNAVLLLAFCAGGCAVTCRHQQWRRTGILLGIGVVAAISLLPYIPTFRSAGQWNMLVQVPSYTFARFWGKLCDTIGYSGKPFLVVWPVLFALAVIIGLVSQLRSRWFSISGSQKDLALFALIALLVGSIGCFVFLRYLSYFTQPWYYFAPIAAGALLIDVLLSIPANLKPWRIARLVVPIVLVFAIGEPWKQAHMRHTNVDVIASELKRAAPEDLIVINQWALGITFQHYYAGAPAWVTIPPLTFHNYHRYDLIKEQMMSTAQSDIVEPVRAKIAETLKAGHRVWMVGTFMSVSAGHSPVILPAAPSNEYGWNVKAYEDSWLMQVGYFVQHHATAAFNVSIPIEQSVGPYEGEPVVCFEGWSE